ncbi:hypothetical protein ACWEKT_20190 [Nocardia takedensis]
MQSFPVSTVQSGFANVLLAVQRDGTAVLTYHDRDDEAVLVIRSELWHETREAYPVDEGKIMEPLAIADARAVFARVREHVVYDGYHAPITRHRREHAVVVPLGWARQARLVQWP